MKIIKIGNYYEGLISFDSIMRVCYNWDSSYVALVKGFWRGEVPRKRQYLQRGELYELYH